jgi:hypothetical protein
MNINSDDFARFINDMIDVRINKILEKRIVELGYIKSWAAKVVNVGVGTADVQLSTDSGVGRPIITGLKNKTGVALTIGDDVYLYSPQSVLTSCYIAIKK